jgi:serine phosphatase RsbU (regulator of sigma subunit)
VRALSLPDRRWRGFSIGLSVALTFAVFAADYVTGAEVAFSLFYLIPIAIATWMVSRRAGALISLLCATAWVVSYLLTGSFYSHPGILYWNTGVELGFFLTFAFTLAAVRRGVETERALIQRLEGANRLLDDEMRKVGDIQRRLLPPTPRIAGYAMAVHYATSTRAGGDYYDFFPLPDARLGVLIADVSGHGTPAAVVMAMMRVLMHSDTAPLDPPERVLTELNRSLSRNILQGQFVTACYATIEEGTGRIEYACAGHNPPLLLRGDRGVVEEMSDGGGLPLGIEPAATYGCGIARLAPGDSVLFYTDGLTEAMDREGHMLGVERVVDLLAARRGADTGALRDALVDEVVRHGGGGPLADDMTLVVIQRDQAASAEIPPSLAARAAG